MNALIKIAQFFAKRPSDVTIRTLKVLLGLAIIGVFGYAPQDYLLPFQSMYEPYALTIKYTYAGLGILPILGGLTGLCVFKRKTMKRVQLVVGLFLLILGISISPTPTPATQEVSTNSGSTSFTALTEKSNSGTSTKIPVGGILIILSLLPIFGGITGKCVTEKCLKYKETIKKIRV